LVAVSDGMSSYGIGELAHQGHRCSSHQGLMQSGLIKRDSNQAFLSSAKGLIHSLNSFKRFGIVAAPFASTDGSQTNDLYKPPLREENKSGQNANEMLLATRL